MAPFTVMTTLASILALSTSVAAYGTGIPYPISNGTFAHGPTGFPTGTSPFTLPTPSCPVPTTVTITATESITITTESCPTTSATVPYPISGSTGLPVGTGTGTGGTGTGSGYPFPTGFAKRMEMRGLKQVKKEKKRGMRFW